MKKILPLLLVLAAIISCRKDEPSPAYFIQKTDSLQRMLNKYTAHGIPGAVIALKGANGSWSGAAGYASLENKTPMKADMLQYGFSITKMVTAVAVMQLREKGLIDLSRPVKDYLPAGLHSLLPNTGAVTVRMLLNHTSGYSDYVRTEAFTETWLNNPLKVWTRTEYYQFIREQVTGLFAPGTDFHYSNTNYYLLSVIIDQVTGKQHAEWYQEHIFNRLALKQTYYKHSPSYPFYRNLPESYWPRLQDGKLENITAAQKAWMQSEEYGANGLIASAGDFIKLLEGLVEGKLVSAASLGDMKQWVQGSGSQEPDYGLGLCYWGFKGKQQWGHDGDGVGATIELIYFPASRTYVVAAANASTEFGGETAQQLLDFRNEVGNYLAGFSE